jgi:hypothetical protein
VRFWNGHGADHPMNVVSAAGATVNVTEALTGKSALQLAPA